MNKNSPTEAGPTDGNKPFTEQQINTINTLFALLKRNYHNQYFKAFANTQDTNAVKRLWLESLQRYDCSLILHASKNMLESEEFLPTLATMIKYCEKIHQRDLPPCHQAYLEACRAPSPKSNYRWSHPAVYYAGRASDWYFLQTNPERQAFPVFREHYQRICSKLLQGETFAAPQPQALPKTASDRKMDKEKARQKLSELRNALQL